MNCSNGLAYNVKNKTVVTQLILPAGYVAEYASAPDGTLRSIAGRSPSIQDSRLHTGPRAGRLRPAWNQECLPQIRGLSCLKLERRLGKCAYVEQPSPSQA